MVPTGHYRVLQVHPTRRCNLRCLHCYSDSSPTATGELEIGVLSRALAAAARLGYTTLAVSGGEPLLYKSLQQLLLTARSHGMSTTVTTNGMLLTSPRVERLTEAVDLLAISLDGTRESHNEMRGSVRAFDAMLHCLETVRSSGIRFGFLFTLTRYNVDQLEAVADFAIAQGASLLQIHPLEVTGRAALTLRGGAPDETEAAYALFEVRRLQATHGSRLRLQLDLVNTVQMAAEPGIVLADDSPVNETTPFADLVSPLVIEADGMVLPLQYGFARHYSLGNIVSAELTELANRWRQDRYPAFHNLARELCGRLASARSPAMLNWYEQISVAAIADGYPAATEDSHSPARPQISRRRLLGGSSGLTTEPPRSALKEVDA